MLGGGAAAGVGGVVVAVLLDVVGRGDGGDGFR